MAPERCRPPCSRIGPANDAERKAALESSPVRGRYDTLLDRESAHEKLVCRTPGREIIRGIRGSFFRRR